MKVRKSGREGGRQGLREGGREKRAAEMREKWWKRRAGGMNTDKEKEVGERHKMKKEGVEERKRKRGRMEKDRFIILCPPLQL